MTFDGSNLKITPYGGSLVFGSGSGDNLFTINRTNAMTLPAVYMKDTSTSGTEMLYVSNTASYTGTDMVQFSSAAGNGLRIASPSTSYALRITTGKMGLDGTAVPLLLNGASGGQGQTLQSNGSSSTPVWGKGLDGGSGTTDGSGNATITVNNMQNSSFGFSSTTTSGCIVVVTSVTLISGNSYSVSIQTQTSSTGAAVASKPFRWTAIG